MSIIKDSGGLTVSQTANLANKLGRGKITLSKGKNGYSISGNFNQFIEGKTYKDVSRVPLKELYAKRKESTLIFPKELPDDYYIIFSAVNRVRRNETEGQKQISKQDIVLPLPSNLGVGYGMRYNETSLGTFGGAAAGDIGSNDFSNGYHALGDKIKEGWGAMQKAFAGKDNDLSADLKALGAGGLATAAGISIAGIVAGALLGSDMVTDVAKGLGVRTGLALNPHMAQVFEGVGFRNHEFSYSFVAKNKEESDEIRKIIAAFKYYMHPNYFGNGGSNLAFEYPEEFLIEFSPKVSPYLHKIGTCVLKGLDVSYNGQQMPIFFESTGAPVNVQIRLQFSEVDILHKGHKDVTLNE